MDKYFNASVECPEHGENTDDTGKCPECGRLNREAFDPSYRIK